MNNELKKYLKQLELEFRVGCVYVYAQFPNCDWIYRRYFNIFGCERMRRCVRQLRSKGMIVNMWRPQQPL